MTAAAAHASPDHDEAELKKLKYLLRQIIDSSPVPTFVINGNHQVMFWNRACESITGRPARDMVGSSNHRRIFYDHERPTMADLIVDGAKPAELRQHYGDKRLTRSILIPGACEAEDRFPQFNEGTWLYFTAAPILDPAGRTIGAIETLQDVTERHEAEEALVDHQKHLETLVQKRSAQLADTQKQLAQTEKLASIGQLAAGVAHEINNPIGFVQSNLESLERYIGQLLQMLNHYEARRTHMAGGDPADQAWLDATEALRRETDIEFLKDDIPALLAESKDGLGRVRHIVQDLRDFSRVDSQQDWELADLRAGLDSTLTIVNSEIRYRADVVKEYGTIPRIECLPAQLNQVFLNLLVNAAQAMPEGRRGTITLRCGSAAGSVWVEVADDGSGIAPDHLAKIFDPFFTTKPVGKGTGLGLSLAYGIIEKHHGRIEVNSTPGVGTTFRITLPVAQPRATAP